MRAFAQVDVFSPETARGNPLAVVLDASGLDDAVMQGFANWTNLSETAFVLPATSVNADYRIRIFTPVRELPFAGHPTLGAAHAWMQSNGAHERDRVIQECAAGLIEVRRVGGLLAFAAPSLLRTGPLDDETLAEILTELNLAEGEVLDHAWVDNGSGWTAVLIRDVARLLSLGSGSVTRRIGVVALHADGSPEVRAFGGGSGKEDPATGALNAGVAEWLLGAGRVRAPYIARQGTALGRAARIHVHRHDDRIWVGGATRTLITGHLDI